MKTSKSLTPEQIRAFRQAYEGSTVSKLAQKAASKTKINDICYDVSHASRMNHKFSIEVPTMGACNQKSSGRCWIFAGMNILREKIGKDLNLPEFELSQSYVSFYDHLEKANGFLEHILENSSKDLDDRYMSMLLAEPVGDGGWWEYFVGLCCKYGAVPKEAMPETYQSSNTASMNMLLNMQLRKDALTLRRALAQGMPEEELRTLKGDMLERVYNLLAICLGNPPESFDFEYVDKDKVYHADRNLTPMVFFEKYIGRDLCNIVSIMNAPAEIAPFHRTCYTQGEESIYGAFQSIRLNLPMEEFKAAVIRQLKAGEPVWFVCDCDYYGSREEGIWDTGLYDYETLLGLDLHMDKKDLLELRQCSLNHAMLLTGVNLVEEKPDKWKVENSWGSEDADKGYFILSDQWFDRYVFTASIHKKYLTDSQRQAFEDDPLVLPPWNILG